MDLKEIRGPIQILLFVPNIIGYLRLALLLLAYAKFAEPVLFLTFYGISIVLDFFDGWAARALGQSSSFGAWLDVIVDNVSRCMLWSNIVKWGWLVVCIEWLTFVCNHQAGSKWREMKVINGKETLAEITAPPVYVQHVMANGFKTGLGTLVILGLHGLPVWMYGMDLWTVYIPEPISIAVGCSLVVGRLLCLSVELWCIYKHVRELLWEDQMAEVKS